MSEPAIDSVVFEVEGRHHAANALTAYCAAVDDRDPARLRELLGGTHVTFRGTPVDGDVAEFYENAFNASPDGPRTRHLFANLAVRHSGSHASADQIDYQASYQRWEHTTSGHTCAALGHYSGTFTTTSGTSNTATTNETARQWAWTTHRVTTNSGL